MALSLARCVLGLGLVLSCLSASAGSADDDLRDAAKAHRNGDTARAMVIWQGWAAQGNVDAAYNLAIIHHYGDGVPLDYAKALHWYRQAADLGDKTAQFQIGLMYQTGQGVKVDEAEAHRWFTMHRKHHLHHMHQPQMAAWRQQALVLIDERDRREQLAASRSQSAQVLADLKQRAGLRDTLPTMTAALETTALAR